MKGITLVSFLPEAFLPLLVVLIGMALVVGARKLAAALAILVLVSIFLPPFLEPVLEQAPLWVLLLLCVLIGLRLFREVAALFLGGRSADTMIGVLAADFVKLLLFFPRFMFRLLFGIWIGRK